MARRLLSLAALSGALAVALGAFGAHVLDGIVRPERLLTLETAVRYQLTHALAAALAAVAASQRPRAALAGALLLIGSLIFSGSLYALVASDRGLFGAVAPIGGATMIAGWLALAYEAWPGRPDTPADATRG